MWRCFDLSNRNCLLTGVQYSYLLLHCRLVDIYLPKIHSAGHEIKIAKLVCKPGVVIGNLIVTNISFDLKHNGWATEVGSDGKGFVEESRTAFGIIAGLYETTLARCHRLLGPARCGTAA